MRTKKRRYICYCKHDKTTTMIKTTISQVKKGDFFKFSNTTNAKVYEKLSGGKITHRYGCVDDFCDEQSTKNGKRIVYIGFEY